MDAFAKVNGELEVEMLDSPVIVLYNWMRVRIMSYTNTSLPLTAI